MSQSYIYYSQLRCKTR